MLAPAMDLEALIELLGLHVRDARVRRAIRRFELVEDRVRDDLYLEGEAAGIALLVIDGFVDTIFLHADGNDGFSEYRGELPAGVSFDSVAADVRRALGEPSVQGSRRDAPRRLARDAWDRYDDPRRSLHLTYARDTGRVRLICLAVPPRGDAG